MRHVTPRAYTILIATALAAILLLSAFLTFSGYVGPSVGNTDDYFYVYYGYLLDHGGMAALAQTNLLAVKYALIYSIGLSIKAFGTSVYSAVLPEYLFFAATIVLVYFIGYILYGRAAGILASFVYGISPIAILQAATVGDTIPATMFVAAAMLFYLLYKRRNLNTYMALSGFFCIIGALTDIEAVIITVPVLALLLLSYFRRNAGNLKRKAGFFAFFCGVALGVVLLLFIVYVIFGNTSYFIRLFDIYVASIRHPFGIGYVLSYPYWMLGLGNPPVQSFYYPALQSYLLAITLVSVASAIILNKRAVEMSTWAVLTFIILIATTMDVTDIPHLRYILVFVPALAVLIGGCASLAIARIRSRGMNKKPYIRAVYAIAVFGLILAISLISLYSIHNVSSLGVLANAPFMQAAKWIEPLHANVYVQGGGLIGYDMIAILSVDTNMNNLIKPLFNTSCDSINSTINSGSYVILNGFDTDGCGMRPLNITQMPNLEEYPFVNATVSYYMPKVYQKR